MWMDSNKAGAYAAYDIPPISCMRQTIHSAALGNTLTFQDHIYIPECTGQTMVIISKLY